MTNSQPVVSICCITYNHEKYISDALDGFLMQKTDFPIEIIIHDDASTDNTVQIIETYRNKHKNLFVTVYQDENQYSKGIKPFHNFVFPLVKGRYIAMCEGDDYWTDPLKLQKQVDFLESNEDYSACFTNALLLNEYDKSKKTYNTTLKEGKVDAKNVFLSGGGLYPTASLVFRTKDLELNIFNEIPELAGDELMITSLFSKGNIRFMNINTCVYRRWSGGVYSSVSVDVEKIVKIKKSQLYGYTKLLNLSEKRFSKYIKRKISLISLYIIRNDNSFKKNKYIKNLHFKDLIRLMLRIN